MMGTTGGARITFKCSAGTCIESDGRFSALLTIGKPQTNTITDRMIHGIHARTACERLMAVAVSELSCSKRQQFFGCQNLSSATRQRIEIAAPAMSTTHGP